MASDYSFALISEPYTGSGDVVKSIQGLNIHQFPGAGRVKACIFSKPNSPYTLGLSQYSTPNLCVAQFTAGRKKLFMASVYIEPNTDESATIERVDFFLKQVNGRRCVIGGDFNGWHPLWGSTRANRRGVAVVELAHSNDMFFCNTGDTPTFETVTHGRDRTSIIDITLASSDLLDSVVNWTVSLDACVTSQHNAIEFSVKVGDYVRGPGNNTSTFMFKNDKAHWATFRTSLHSHMSATDALEQDISTMTIAQLENFINQITDIIQTTCRESMPVRGSGICHKPPWWTDELEIRKREVIDLHRHLHVMKKRNLPTDALAEEHSALKATYANELRAASTSSFRDFCELQTKENVWSLTNRLLKDSNPRRPPTTLKIHDQFTTNNSDTAQALLHHFYPEDTMDTDQRHHELRQHYYEIPDTTDDPPFAKEEVLEMTRHMNPKKAPGLDGLTADICQVFASEYTGLLTDIYNRCLTLQHFPGQWKRAYIKIIPKPNKTDYASLDSYRPIGLIPVFGKVLEKLFIKRVTYIADKAGKLSNSQYGFREQVSTTMAIDAALSRVRQAKANGEVVVAVSLDIKAAFDSAWWPAMFSRLRQIRCPKNIYGLICNYHKDREVLLDIANTRVTKSMSKGCVQGSVCGPMLWNFILDELLKLELPPGCHVQAFADDVLLVTHAKIVEDLQVVTNRALESIVNWGKGVKLRFGPQKTKAIAFTNKAKAALICIEGQTLKFEREIKYLGVIIDEKLLFNSHAQYVIKKAARIFNKLCLYCRPTWGAHPENIQTIYRQVIEPTVTYAAGIWGHAAYKKGIRRKLLSLQRGFAIRAIKAYRTVSTPAAIALAQFTPLDLKVREVHVIEQVKLTGKTHLLPHDITLEQATPPHQLLHPSQRVTITPLECTDLSQITQLCTRTTTQIYTDGSKKEDSSVGAAFVCYQGTNLLETKRFKLHSSCSVFQAEMYAIYRACLWVTNYRHRHKHTHKREHRQHTTSYIILTDSMASIHALRNRSHTNPLVAQTHRLIHELTDTDTHTLQFAWVRSHVGILGNEAADQAAKSATDLHRSPDYHSFPPSFVKYTTRTENRRTWQARFDSATQGRRTKTLLPKLENIAKLFKLTKMSFHLTQILTGHGLHRQYLHRFRVVDDATCPCNNDSIQTLEHLLTECPRFSIHRQDHEITCDNLKVSPYVLTELLEKPVALESYVNLSSSILKSLKQFNERTLPS